jgi:uncharacterized membrane protein YbhN (UPF0104 family)
MNGSHTVRPGTRRRLWQWARVCGGALIIVVLILRLGADPFLDGVRQVNAASLIAAVGITAMTTVISAWRWQLIARGLGLRIPLGRAVASYYRSQFLNSTLPGGVLGDLHRGVVHGEEANDVSRGLRSVVWDRTAGQIVQVLLATMTLFALASPIQPAIAVVVGVSITAMAVIALIVLAIPRRGRSWTARLARTVRADVRAALIATHAWPAIFIASTLVVLGHAGVFLIAATATADGSPTSIGQLLPLTMLVLLAMSVPTNIGGWGPREGVAAWAFAIAGLGAIRGVETATMYGVLSFAATLPGAVVLVLSRRPGPSSATSPVRADVLGGTLVEIGPGRGGDG